MKLDQESFDDLINVMQLGAGYWADIDEATFDPDTGQGRIKLYELDEMGNPEDTHDLTTDSVLRVLNRLSEYRLAEDIKGTLARHHEEDFLIHVDAEVADCWLQLATFGKLVYA